MTIGMDVIRVMYDHIRKLPKDTERINLFLHSNGGDTTVPWKLVTLMRERCKYLRVLVPHNAFSAATLIALGADEIYMHPMGVLGPTDISIRTPFNPRDANTGAVLSISVEEVLAYLALVREDAGINHEDQVVQAFSKLVDFVHPLALGTVKRSHAQSRLLARKLMEAVETPRDKHAIEEVVSHLTSKLYYHGHPINRGEARDIGLQVIDANSEIEDAIWDLYELYEGDLLLREPYSEIKEFEAKVVNLPPGQSQSTNLKIRYGYVESRERCDVYTADLMILGTRDAHTGVLTTGRRVDREGWEEEV
jgi:nucleotide-binding universal stress UspA family protein